MLRLILCHILAFSIVSQPALARQNRRRSLRKAVLQISGGTFFDFGQKFVGRHYDRTITISNVGTKVAKDIQPIAPQIKPPFTYKGDRWPGIGGTCNGILRGGQTCKVVVRFEPKDLGTFQSYLRIGYFNGRKNDSVTKTLGGSAVEEGCMAMNSDGQELRVTLGGKLKRKLGPGNYRCAIKMNDEFRSYNLHVPSRYYSASSLPLVLVFHGGAETAIGIEAQTDFSKKADRENFLVAYPIGASSSRLLAARKSFDSQTWLNTDQDVEFIRRLVKHMNNNFKVDSHRIYATGMSNGAAMVYRLACDMADTFAAVAPLGGGNLYKQCQPSEPISILHIHGAQDPGWPFDGGITCFSGEQVPPVMASLVEFQKFNGCEGRAQPPEKTFDRGDATCFSRKPCLNGTEVTLCTIEKGGLTWPGGRLLALSQEIPWSFDCGVAGNGKGVGNVTRDLSATRTIWEFFTRHKKK